ncbi:hypothetical protein [Bacillus sp. 165]|uniref:hypothetical protein n=1 Tax=Bacillus sp. 165 TaxID=1529117 RepID=UPI001ADC34F2|nr:hypothetical protein [Bacillus sp. 165]MBO9130870.1 hypothetical protein [Bacillus sp. 165]
MYQNGPFFDGYQNIPSIDLYHTPQMMLDYRIDPADSRILGWGWRPRPWFWVPRPWWWF